jgi:hypothetical protein
MTTPTVTEIRRNGNLVGEQIELARYSVPVGERVLYGQRVNGVVRFQLEACVVLDAPRADSEDCRCRARGFVDEEVRPDASRQERLNGDGSSAGAVGSASRRGRTGARVELARYRVSVGERVLYGQRVLGVVRVTDVPVGEGRSYLVERELELDGYGALQALIADYLRQADRLDAVPMADVGFSFGGC